MSEYEGKDRGNFPLHGARAPARPAGARRAARRWPVCPALEMARLCCAGAAHRRRHAPVDTRRSGEHRHHARGAVGALPAAVAAAGPVRPKEAVLLRVFPAAVRRLEGGAEPRRRACRAAAPARARRRGAVVRAGARAARVVLARGDGKRRLHRRGAWHGV